MERMQYAEAVVKKFLLFHGFTNTPHSFDAEVKTDIGHGFQVDRIVDLLFTVYVPRFEADNLIKLMVFLQQSFISSTDARYHSTFMKLQVALKKYYIVNAVQKGNPDQVLLFFQRHRDSLLRNGRGDDWHDWFALPYMKHPSIDPRFQVYFSKEWLDTLVVSFRNVLSEVLGGIRLPTLLRLHNERLQSKTLKQELGNMQAECANLRKIVQEREAEISKLERKPFLVIRAPSQDAGFPLLGEMLLVSQLMGRLGYGHQMLQLQLPEMQRYILGLRSWLWSRKTNLTFWKEQNDRAEPNHVSRCHTSKTFDYISQRAEPNHESSISSNPGGAKDSAKGGAKDSAKDRRKLTRMKALQQRRAQLKEKKAFQKTKKAEYNKRYRARAVKVDEHILEDDEPMENECMVDHVQDENIEETRLSGQNNSGDTQNVQMVAKAQEQRKRRATILQERRAKKNQQGSVQDRSGLLEVSINPKNVRDLRRVARAQGQKKRHENKILQENFVVEEIQHKDHNSSGQKIAQ